MKIYILLSEYQHSDVFNGVTLSLDEALKHSTEDYCWSEEWDTDRLQDGALRTFRNGVEKKGGA